MDPRLGAGGKFNQQSRKCVSTHGELTPGKKGEGLNYGKNGREQIKGIFGKFGNNLAGKKREREFQGLIG